MDIEAYIQQLKEQQQDQDTAKQEKRLQEQAEAESERLADWATFNREVSNLLPELVRPYFRAEVPEQFEVDQYHQAIHLDVPGCTPIRLFVKTVRPGAYELLHTRDYDVDFATYELKEQYHDYGPDSTKVVLDRYVQAADLDAALLLSSAACDQWLTIQQQAIEINAARAKYWTEEEQRSAQREAEQALQLQIQSEQAAIKADEQRVLFEQVQADPIALSLLTLFAAVQNERAEYLAQIESLSEHAGSLEGWHAERVAKLERSLDEARRNAENYRSEKDNLERDLDQTQRDIKKLKRQLA